MAEPARGRFLRARADDEEQRASALELFFDLVFVFAVTQLSVLLHEHLTWSGAGQTLFLLLVVWWAWTYTVWMANWFDPESPAVRLLLIGVTLASLFMAIAIPDAFGERALMFALAYTGLQIVRTSFVVYAAETGSRFRANFARILSWELAAGILWIAGALLDGPARVAVWLVALLVDYAGPSLRFWTPRLGRAAIEDWVVEPAHFAERFQLFVIIALGESIVVTGATASGSDITAGRAAAIAVAFLGSAALWWLYFSYVARIAQLRLELAGEARGRLARDAYTYIHLVMVAGIIVTAVGDELVIAHPDAHLGAAELAALAAGPALYLVGHSLFRRRMAGSFSRKRLVGAAVICGMGALGAVLPALATATLITAVLVCVIAAELVSARRRQSRGQPSPIERLLRESGGSTPAS